MIFFFFSLSILDGAARSGASLFNEFKNALFSRVSQNAVRTVARNVFFHLHSLDLSFHLNKNTGSLSRAIDRGTKFFFYFLMIIQRKEKKNFLK